MVTILPKRAGQIALLVLAVAIGVSRPALSAPRETLAAGDQGTIEFKTLTLTSDQFMAGSKVGEDVVISGALNFPKGAGKVPALIISHGGCGIARNETGWVDELRPLGLATFFVDSFGGRSIRCFPADSTLNRRAQVLDLWRALALLSTHPRIDSKRIGLMGFSRGGRVVILAADSLQSPYFPPNVDVAVYLAVYPSLPPEAEYASWQLHARPIRIFQGMLDDVTPLAAARRFVEVQRAKGFDVKMFEYPNSRHVFDNPGLPPAVSTPIGTIGYNGQAAAQAFNDMEKTLREVLRLKGTEK